MKQFQQTLHSTIFLLFGASILNAVLITHDNVILFTINHDSGIQSSNAWLALEQAEILCWFGSRMPVQLP